MKRLTFSFFLGLMASCAYGEHIESTVTALPIPQTILPSKAASLTPQSNLKSGVQVWTADDIRRYLRINGALNTCANFSVILQQEIETLRDDIQKIQEGIRSLVRQNSNLGIDAHTAELLASCYEDCFDKLLRFPKNSAKSPYSDCILWLKNFQGTLENLNNRLCVLAQTLRMAPKTTNISTLINSTLELAESATDKLNNKVFNKPQILLPILHEFSQKERSHGWHNTPWL